MTQQKVPFSIDLWQQGWKPVTRDGEEVEELNDTNLIPFPLEGKINGKDYVWRRDGLRSIRNKRAPHLDLFLLPPDEIVVEVIDGAIKGPTIPNGKYRLQKID